MKNLVMKTMMLLFLILLLGCAGTIPRPSLLDVPEVTNQSDSSPQFTAIKINVIPPDSQESKLYVFVKIPHSELIFVPAGSDGYYAAFKLEEQITYRGEQIDYYAHLLRTHVYPKYDLTKSTDLFSRIILKYKGAAPARRILNLKLADINAPQNSSHLSIPLTIRSIRTDKLGISDPAIFFANIESEKLWSMLFDTSIDKLTISSLNPEFLNPWQEMNVVFEVYFPEHLSLENKELVAGYNLNRNREPILEKKQTIEITDTTIDRKVIGIPLQLPEDAEYGTYSLAFYAYIQDKNTKTIESNSIVVNKKLQFYSPMPRGEAQMKDAFDALKYVIPYPKKTDKAIKKAKTTKEKIKLFDTFWAKQGPYSLQEYYRRIQYAKQRGSGLDTDMGKVVIRFGIPDPLQIDSWGSSLGYADIKTWSYPGISPRNSTRHFYFPWKTFIFVSVIGGTYDFGRFGAIGAGDENYNDILRRAIYEHNESEFYTY
ncbi:GWxTD domain-containing protein [Patescibacteria group bacterium AH-259-L05]|nr:GWxTD domain-containing protein [Patescibacteria group bacterium AH-259-L05]